jgi:hypothetical protein
MAAHNVTTKKDIVKPLQYVQEAANTVTTPTSYGTTPTASPTFVAAGLNTEITLNPDVVHQDVDVLGSEDVVDAVKTGELYTFTTRFNPTDSVLINYGLVTGAGTGTIDASLSFIFSERLDGTENYTILKGCRPTSTTLSLERGTWGVDMTWICKEITTPSATHGLTTPTFVSIPTASPLTHTDAGADPFAWNSVATPERRFSTTVTREMAVLSVNGSSTITFAKPTSRRVEFSVDAFVKNTTLLADFKTKTARGATYTFSTSPSKVLTYTNCVLSSWSSAKSATTTDAFVESITARAEGLTIA